MKLKPGFIVRTIAGQNIVLSSGENGNLHQMISLNESGMFIWRLLEQETQPESIADSLMTHYGIDQEQATQVTHDFLDKLREYHFIIE